MLEAITHQRTCNFREVSSPKSKRSKTMFSVIVLLESYKNIVSLTCYFISKEQTCQMYLTCTCVWMFNKSIIQVDGGYPNIIMMIVFFQTVMYVKGRAFYIITLNRYITTLLWFYSFNVNEIYIL